MSDQNLNVSEDINGSIDDLNVDDAKLSTITLPKAKSAVVNIKDCYVDNRYNTRFQSGQSVCGLTIATGTYDIVSMKTEILQHKRIHTPLQVEKMPDGRYLVLIGNRRCLAGNELLNDPKTDEETKASLKKVDVLVYEKLNDEQRYKIVNDQNSKAFGKTEIVVHVMKLNDKGMSYPDIIVNNWRMLLPLSNQAGAKLRKLEDLQTPQAQKVFLCTWFRGTIDNTIIACNNLGPICKRNLIFEFMVKDGILKLSDKPENYFKIDFKRLGELKNLQKEEKTVWSVETGSPLFNEKIAEYVLEDKLKEEGYVAPKTAPNKKEIGTKQLQCQKDGLVYKSLGWVLGEEVDLKDLDVHAKRCEMIYRLVRDGIEKVKNPELANLFRQLTYANDEPAIANLIASL